MGKLIIDGKSVFEIDEECVKQKKIPETCDIKKYFKDVSAEGKPKESNTKKNIL